MIELDLTGANPQLVRNRWADSKRVSKGIDMEDVMKEAAVPVRVMLKWLSAMWMVQQIQFTIELELEAGVLPGHLQTGPLAAAPAGGAPAGAAGRASTVTSRTGCSKARVAPEQGSDVATKKVKKGKSEKKVTKQASAKAVEVEVAPEPEREETFYELIMRENAVVNALVALRGLKGFGK